MSFELVGDFRHFPRLTNPLQGADLLAKKVIPLGEATVVINGVTLTIGQAMTLRVAVTNFLIHMQDEGLGDDEQGKAMTAAYILRASEVEALLAEPQLEDPV